VSPVSQSRSLKLESPLISVVFAYYENPSMLKLQWDAIAQFPQAVKNVIEIVVVDDGSPSHPAGEVARGDTLPSHSIFRIGRDIRWNQDAARNIGAYEARGSWLLLTDIDHMVPPSTLMRLIEMERDPTVIYSFPRIKFETQDARDPHPNSYFMTKDMYWAIGGHDEDYKGIYGKDFLFRKRALRHAKEVLVEGDPLVRVGKITVWDSASRTITRNNTLRQRIWGYVLEWLKAAKLWRGVQTLTESYRRVV